MPPSLAPAIASLLTRAWLCAVTIRSVPGAISAAVTSLGSAWTTTSMPTALAAAASRSSPSWTTTLAISTPRSRSVFRVVTPKWREPTRVIRMGSFSVGSVPTAMPIPQHACPFRCPARYQQGGPVAMSGRRQLAHQNLVDAPAVEIDDLELPALGCDLRADLGDRAEGMQQKTRRGLVRPR